MTPRLKLLYLTAVAVAACATRRPDVLAGLCLLQGALWAWNRLPARELGRVAGRLWFFALALVASYALFPPESVPGALWRELRVSGWTLRYNEHGLLLGALMTLRMLAVIAASRLVQALSEPGAMAAGLRGLLVPEKPARVIEATLDLLAGAPAAGGGGGGDGGGGGRGGGGGGGRGRHRRDGEPGAPGAFTLQGLRRLFAGDFGHLVDMIENGLARSRERAGAADTEQGRDVAVLSGICALMLGTKLLKVLPGVPFAPGYKVLFLIPLYILAARLTRAPWGATLAGGVTGLLSFLMGDGRFGLFEVLKHLAPGLVVDAARPFLPERPGGPATLFYVALGGLAAAARTTTMLAVIWFVEGGGPLYLLAGFSALSQVFFGALSGLVTAAVLGAHERLRRAAEPQEVGGDG